MALGANLFLSSIHCAIIKENILSKWASRLGIHMRNSTSFRNLQSGYICSVTG
jgi:hypothetical protein